MSENCSPIALILAAGDVKFTILFGISELDPAIDLQNLSLGGIRIGPGEDLRGYDFSYSVLVGADFSGADLSGASFAYCDLRGANLTGAKFVWEQFSGANLQDACFTEGDHFQDLEKSNLSAILDRESSLPGIVTVSRGRRGGNSDEMLTRARQFLVEYFFRPAEEDHTIPKRLRTLISRTKSKVFQFERIGDLVSYVDRFSRKGGDQLPLGLEYKSRALEDIHSEFSKIFGKFSEDKSSPFDLVLGVRYSSFYISSLAGIYTSRGGGIYVVGKVGRHSAVLVRATMQGGERFNRWIERGVRLQYCLKPIRRSGNTIYDERGVENRAIADFPDVPIHVFARENSSEKGYLYFGIFKNVGVQGGEAEPRWFDLVKRDHVSSSELI